MGNKAKNLIKLQQYGYNIPKTYIFDYDSLKSIDLKNISPDKNYIIRPSGSNEDSINTSMAGVYRSHGPLNYDEVIDFLKNKKDNINYYLSGTKNNIIDEIIIQEFVYAEYYGVYFTRNPQSILLPGGYDISNKRANITGGLSSFKKISWILEKKLEEIGKKVEKHFGYPQDIEFAIKDGKIIILQTRPISTFHQTENDFIDMSFKNGIYHNINNGEFGDIPYFGISLLYDKDNYIIDGKNILVRKIFTKGGMSNIQNKLINLKDFRSKYFLYLKIKLICLLLERLIFFQKYNKYALKHIYKNYEYTLDITKVSTVRKHEEYKIKSFNLKTKLLLIREKYKNMAFAYLEGAKKQLLKINKYGNDIAYLHIEELLNNSVEKNSNIILSRKNLYKTNCIYIKSIFLYNGISLKKSIKQKEKWIYKGKIEGKRKKLKDIDLYNSNKYIGIVDNLSENIEPYMNHLSGLIAKDGSIYSHNAILLREWKIPSLIE